MPPDQQCIVDAVKEVPESAGFDCFCEIAQASGAALHDCRTASTPEPSSSGFCYVDASTVNTTLLSQCPSDEKLLLRFVGAGAPAMGAGVFLSCQ